MGKSLRIEAASKVRVPKLASMNTGAMATAGAAAATADGAPASLDSAGSDACSPFANGGAGGRFRVAAGSVGGALKAAAHPRRGSAKSTGATNGESSYDGCTARDEPLRPTWRGSTGSAD